MVVLYSKCWIVPSPPPGPPPISCLGRICNVYTWVIGKRNANTVPSKFMLHNIEKPTWSLPRDLLSLLFMKPQHISFIWYAGEGGPGHEEGRPSALLNIGHQSQTWLWYFFKFWSFETFGPIRSNYETFSTAHPQRAAGQNRKKTLVKKRFLFHIELFISY